MRLSIVSRCRTQAFDGFRVVRFQMDDGIWQRTEAPGLKYSVDFGMGMLKALFLGDVLNDLTHSIRAYEVNPGETNRVMDLCVRDLCDHLRDYKAPSVMDKVPGWVASSLETSELFAPAPELPLQNEAASARERIPGCPGTVPQTDRQHRRGPHAAQARGQNHRRVLGANDREQRQLSNVRLPGARRGAGPAGSDRDMDCLPPGSCEDAIVSPARHGFKSTEPGRWNWRQRFRNELGFQKKRALLAFGEHLYSHLYHQVIRSLGSTAHTLVSQEKLAHLADPFYQPLARGGEGYLEVGKNIYYHTNKLCHMVLSLKPFGCLPSSQSDGVQSAVISKFRDMIYLPIETSGEGEVQAHSRVQMALGEAKTKAKVELQQALAKTGTRIDDIRAFAEQHSELRRPLYRIPHKPGVAGVAANFVFHVSDLMAGRQAYDSDSRFQIPDSKINLESGIWNLGILSRGDCSDRSKISRRY